MPLRRKLIAILIAASTVPLLLTGGILIAYEYLDSRDEVKDELRTLALVTEANAAEALARGDRNALERTLGSLAGEPDVTAACVYDLYGTLLAARVTPASHARCPASPGHAGMTSASNMIAITHPLLTNRVPSGSLYLRFEMQPTYARLMAYVRTVGVVLLLAFFLAVLLSAWLQHLIADPILRLTAVALGVCLRKDYTLRVSKTTDNEVGILIDAFNSMLEQIAARSSEMTKMNADLRASKEAAELAATALTESEKRFHATFDEAPIGMALVDSEGRVVEANESLRQMLGYNREELLGKSFSEVTYTSDLQDATSRFAELRSGVRERYQVERRYLKKNGDMVWARLTVSRLHVRRSDFLAIAMAEDITGHKQLEEQYRQAQKMEAIGTLAGGVAHDFNNLLTVIKGHSELLSKRLTSDHPMSRNLGQVQRAADRAVSLVDQLLAFSRKQIVDPRTLDLNTVVRDLEPMLRRLIREDIELDVSAGTPEAWVKADRTQLEQILLNLAVNARDAMPGGGRLEIRTAITLVTDPPQQIAEMPCGRYVQLAVEDSGAGMSVEVQSHIFEPFFTTKEVGQGTGLGLATVYGTVKQACGYIAVDSAPGRGSTFTIYLPFAEAPSRAHDASTDTGLPVSGGGETVLLVEDEEQVRAMLCETLTAQGYHVLEAHDGEHALEIAAGYAGPIHVLLTDVIMPRINGPELGNRILQKRPGISVLYISGYGAEDSVLEKAFLKKPFTPDELADKLRLTLHEAKHVS